MNSQFTIPHQIMLCQFGQVVGEVGVEDTRNLGIILEDYLEWDLVEALTLRLLLLLHLLHLLLLHQVLLHLLHQVLLHHLHHLHPRLLHLLHQGHK